MDRYDIRLVISETISGRPVKVTVESYWDGNPPQCFFDIEEEDGSEHFGTDPVEEYDRIERKLINIIQLQGL